MASLTKFSPETETYTLDLTREEAAALYLAIDNKDEQWHEYSSLVLRYVPTLTHEAWQDIAVNIENLLDDALGGYGDFSG